MAQGDLLFRRAPAANGNLVFGEEEVTLVEGSLAGALPGLQLSALVDKPNDASLAGALPGLGFSAVGTQGYNATLTASLPGLQLTASGEVFSGYVFEGTLSATMPALGFRANVDEPRDATLAGALPGLGFTAQVNFNSNTERPVVGQMLSKVQQGIMTRAWLTHKVERGQTMHVHTRSRAQQAVPVRSWLDADQAGSLARERAVTRVRHQDGAGVRGAVLTRHAEMLRDRREVFRSSAQQGIGLRNHVESGAQDRDRLRTVHAGRSQQAIALRRAIETSAQKAVPVRVVTMTRFQQAMKPPAGQYKPPIPPTPEPCYTPNPHLLFDQRPSGPHLLFVCENHEPPPVDTVVVPIRKVYIVLNDVSLRRVVGNLSLPALSLSLSIDVDSWTWSFNASLPAAALGDIDPIAGEPVELEASINGNLYRVLAENISRERVFGKNTIRVSGRGKSALLAAPYAPVMSFANSTDRTAQQLMADVLTLNGVPIGWDIDWTLSDWLVPAGAFSMRGTYIEGLQRIASAAGAYLQPDPVSQELRALLRYPVMPWDWGTATPDFEIPSAVMTREGIEWKTKPAYNRVWVRGEAVGVLGQVTRAGTAGDLEAPMIVDPLITAAVAARQRGMSVLGDTGRQAIVTLSLPVLPETGVIPPGKLVKYVDGSVERIGLTRAVSLDFGGSARLRQSITVETHEA